MSQSQSPPESRSTDQVEPFCGNLIEIPPSDAATPGLLAISQADPILLATPQSRKPAEVAKPSAQPSGGAAIGQTLFFLLAMASMLAAARFAMPTIVEEIRYSWHRGELRAKYEASGDGLKNVSLGALSEAYQMVTQHVGPSVVHIEVIRQADESQAQVAKLLGTNFSDDFSPLSDQGSGVVIDGDGYVMTNYHVIADGSQIQVGLSDGRRVPATVVGTDPLTDLALLKISADRLIPIRWGDSDLCEVGSPVWAVGSPFGLDRTVTFGILSGKHRVVKASTRYQDFMQSDAAVNPGNSGGPLVDANGELVGINTAIVGDTFRGVSFSIPSNVVKSVYERLRATGRVDRGWLGVALDEVPDEMVVGDDYRVRGAIITGLAGGDSPAARGGAQAGDIIIRLNDQPIEDVGHMMRVTGNLAAGTRIKLDVVRGEGQVVLELVVGARPESLSMR
jgi:S1-C subfamily serine protease